MQTSRNSMWSLPVILLAVCALYAHPHYSPRIPTENVQQKTPPKTTKYAQLQAVDKVTGTFSSITIPLDKPFKFNDLRIRLQYCIKPDPFAQPEHKAFLKIEHSPNTNNQYIQVFSGWMFSSSPAINTLENHPRYSLWLTKCINPRQKQNINKK